MKEVTYGDWQKNPTPRMMWVWDVNENTGLKTRWQCRNKYMCKENGEVVPCYTLYDCLNCHYKTG